MSHRLPALPGYRRKRSTPEVRRNPRYERDSPTELTRPSRRGERRGSRRVPTTTAPSLRFSTLPGMRHRDLPQCPPRPGVALRFRAALGCRWGHGMDSAVAEPRDPPTQLARLAAGGRWRPRLFAPAGRVPASRPKSPPALPAGPAEGVSRCAVHSPRQHQAELERRPAGRDRSLSLELVHVTGPSELPAARV